MNLIVPIRSAHGQSAFRSPLGRLDDQRVFDVFGGQPQQVDQALLL